MEATAQPTNRRSAAEVFGAFLKLGCTSFGGPVAHLGFFREEFVNRRKWLSDAEYADLVALCQFLPGPASSQVGMALGLRRAGVAGMVAAWVAFTVPSAIALVCFALGVSKLGNVADAGWLIGMKAAAVAVVAHALIGMASSLVTDKWRAHRGGGDGARAACAECLRAGRRDPRWRGGRICAAARSGPGQRDHTGADPAEERRPG